ncbi:MAG: HU family DNA-binding protein [Kiritimatiellia bacterium]
MKKQMLKNGHVDRRALALCLAACILTGALVRAVLPEGRSVDIHLDGGDVQLTLPGIGNAPYAIQVKTSLTDAWEPLGTVIGADGVTMFPVTLDSPSAFFRVLFPQPTLVAGEPALLAASGGSTVYVIGQFFYAGDQIFVDGLLLSDVTFISSTLLSGTLPDLSTGLHDIEVIEYRNGDSLPLASLPKALEVAPSLARTLQAPPAWPPAGPAPAFVKGNGHITILKSRGDDDCDGTDDGVYASAHLDTWGDPHEKIAANAPAPGVMLASDLAPHSRRPRGLFPRRHTHNHGVHTRNSTPPTHITILKSHSIGEDNDCDGGDDDDDDDILGVLLHSGEVEQQVADLAVPGRGLDFLWMRTYRSRTGVATAQGNRWSHSYDVRCVQSSNGIDLYDGTGRKDTFRLQANGTYTCPEFFREGTLNTDTGAFRLTFADTGYWEFNPFDSASPTSGKLAQIVDRHDNTMTLSYDGSGRLTTIVDDLDRTYTVAYNPAGEIASVSDFSGRTVTYAYYSAGDPNGRSGDLKSVTSPVVTNTSTGNNFPSGKTTTYTYITAPAPEASGLLLSITDALDQTTVHCVYDLDSASPTFARCVSVQRGTDAPTCITYLPQTPAPGNRFAALRCIVNDPEGNVSEHDFDSRNRCVALREYTGRAESGQAVTATANRPMGKLRAADPDRFESSWSWNNDSLCTVWQRPLTNRIEWVYQADLDSATPPRQRGNLRVERRIAHGGLDDDDDGLSTSLVSSFEHDPRFGSDPTLRGWDGTYKGHAQVSRGNVEVCDSRDNDCSGFVTRVTNPRGFETHCIYDDNGNLATLTQHGIVRDVTPPVMARIDFEHNAYGQLTACVRAEDGAGRRRRDEYTYYASGAQRGYLQTCIVDADATGQNLTTSLEYDARGNLTRCVDPRGTPTEIEVNALNQIVSKQTQGGSFGTNLRSYVYDANNNLVQVDVENRAPDGTLNSANPYWTTTLAYDALNRPIQTAQEISPSGQSNIMTNQFVYDANDRLTLQRLPEAVSGADPDNVIAFASDERGLLYSRACAPGSGLSTVDFYDYDGNGNLRKVREAAVGMVSETTCVYDGFDRPIQTVDAMGNVSTCLYDGCDNRTYTRTDGELVDLPGGALNLTLAESTFTYDPLNRLTRKSSFFFDLATGAPISDGVAQTDWSYAPNGQLLTLTDDNGHTSARTYDRVGRLTSVIDPKGNVIAKTYDENGNPLTVQTADLSDVSAGSQLFTQTLTYDALDRCVSVTDNVGNTVSNAYDSSHNLVSIIDALGNESVCTVDGLGRVTGITHYSGSQADGLILSTSHSAYRNNRLVSSTDGNGNTTTFVYDACDRCIAITHPDDTSETRGWSAHGNLAWYTDANGTTVTNNHNSASRLVGKEVILAAGISTDTTFETLAYDGLGHLVAAANDTSAFSFAYDSLGNRTQSAQDGLVTTSTYDGTGNRLTLTCPDGRGIFTTYDALGLPTAVSTQATASDSPVAVATFAYDGPGRFAKIARNNAINTRIFWNGEQNTPNAANDFGWQQVARINHARAGGGQVVDQRNSGYDRNQNQNLRVMTAPWTSGGVLTENSYAYDGLNRLTRGTRSFSPAGDSVQSYILDPNGNRLQMTNNGLAEAYVMDNTIPPGDAQMNQYTVTPSGSFTYDANGNRISSTSATGQRVYHYDYANRLVKVDELVAGSAPTTVVSYRYSPVVIDRRMEKSTPNLLAGGTGTTTNTYLYDYGTDNDCDGVDDDCDSATGGNLLQTYVDGVLQRSFFVPHALEKFGALASVSGGAVLFHHYDEQGSLLALTDAKGDVVERFDYDDYGAPIFFDAAGSPRPSATAPLTDVLQLFQGMTWNPETGLYGGGDTPSPYMNKGELIDAIAKDAGLSVCRYFNPKTGRTLTRADDGGDAPYLPSMNKAELIDAMAKVAAFSQARYTAPSGRSGKAPRHDLSRSSKSNSLYEFGLSRRRSQLKKGNPVELIGSGKWSISERAARTGRNPQTGKEIKIAAKKAAKFKAGKALADVVK